jgi:toxin YoeB
MNSEPVSQVNAPDRPPPPPRESPAAHPKRRAIFMDSFRADLEHWVRHDRRITLRLLHLVEEVLRDPHGGLARPERLRHDFAGCLARRLTQEHRIVYTVDDDAVTFLMARFHYRR